MSEALRDFFGGTLGGMTGTWAVWTQEKPLEMFTVYRDLHNHQSVSSCFCKRLGNRTCFFDFLGWGDQRSLFFVHYGDATLSYLLGWGGVITFMGTCWGLLPGYCNVCKVLLQINHVFQAGDLTEVF